MMENLDKQIQLTSQAPYKLAFKSSVAGSAASVGRQDDSLKLVMEVLLINPAFIPANEVLAVNRLLDGDLEMAVAEFENLIRIDPSSKLGNYGKTILLCVTGHQQDALNGLLEMTEDSQFEQAGHYLLQRLLGLSPESYLHGSLFRKLSNAVKEGKAKTAHDLLADISNTPVTPRLQIVLADFLVARGEKKSAKKILEQLSDAHPFYPSMLYRLGKLELSESNKSKSSELFQLLLDTDPIFNDSDNVICNEKSIYSEPTELSELSDLRQWCLEVIKRVALAQKPMFTPEIEQIQIKIGENSDSDSTEVVEIVEPEQVETPEEELPPIEDVPIVERHHELAMEPPRPPEKTSEPLITRISNDEEPDKATEELQLSRTRKILEQAKIILDQTRVEVDKQREEQLKQELIAEAHAELERQRHIEEIKEEEYDGPTLFDFDKPVSSYQTPTEPPEQLISLEQMHQVGDSFGLEGATESIVDELPEYEEIPRRIVLPTSDEAPQNTPERAWQLLKAGEAEEAFMMFSKLLKR
ncbi:MAG: hypothetical protein KA140_07090 [Caldisericia bacterium]|nr:hypothetical protein [Caldisericia bacterium]